MTHLHFGVLCIVTMPHISRQYTTTQYSPFSEYKALVQIFPFPGLYSQTSPSGTLAKQNSLTCLWSEYCPSAATVVHWSPSLTRSRPNTQKIIKFLTCIKASTTYSGHVRDLCALHSHATCAGWSSLVWCHHPPTLRKKWTNSVTACVLKHIWHIMM